MLQTSKHERDALLRARKKLASVLAFLKSRGFSEENVLADCSDSPLLFRDEFGLPVLKNSPPIKSVPDVFVDLSQKSKDTSNVGANCSAELIFAPDPFKDKLKGKLDDSNVLIQETKPVVELVDSKDRSPDISEHLAPNATNDKDSGDLKQQSPAVHVSSPNAEDTLKSQQENIPNSGQNNDSDWQQVKKKNSSSPQSTQAIAELAATSVIPSTDGNKSTSASSLPIYAALSRTLSKNQRKKARRSGGKTPPFKH
ncbi:hypothetical protein ACET3Z_013179 [Daucus carota]